MRAVELQANSEETAMLTRRDILKAGLAGSAYGLLGPAFRRSAFGDSLPPSPATKPFVVELPIAPLAKSVAPFASRAAFLPPLAAAERHLGLRRHGAGADVPRPQRHPVPRALRERPADERPRGHR